MNSNNKKYSVALIGARGYVGKELIKLLNQHPNLDLHLACSRKFSGQLIEDYTKKPLHFTNLNKQQLVQQQCDIYILALPNGYAEEYVNVLSKLQPQGIIIDLSADYRFNNDWQYSQPETSKPVQGSKISNPGCYATAMQLAIAPISALINTPVHCFGISGYSGAGTTPSDKNSLTILKDNILAYQLTNHLHEKEVSWVTKKKIFFSPHVASFFRGIALTVQMSLQKSIHLEGILSLYQSYYLSSPLISIQQAMPQVSQVTNSHKVIIGGFSLSNDQQQFAVHIVLDNLLKGAATQAIQNINLALALPSLTGINYE